MKKNNIINRTVLQREPYYYEIIDLLDESNEKIRALFSGNVFLSIMYTREEILFDLYDDYSKLFDIVVNSFDNIENTLVLGGGGFSYPKYYISKYLDKKMDVVEIDKKLIEISKDYFYLNELHDKYDPKHKRLNIIIDDAFHYIRISNKKYDYILIDLFFDNNIVIETFKEDNINNLYRLLNENGVIAVNFLSLENNYHLKQLVVESLKKRFKYNKIITIIKYKNLEKRNELILCSNRKIELIEITKYIDLY